MFPLTLALSPRARENVPQRSRKPQRVRTLPPLDPVLPLPKGEGRGEGEEGVARIPRPRRRPNGFELFIVSSPALPEAAKFV